MKYENKAKISSHHGVELQEKIHGECHIFNQSEQSCLDIVDIFDQWESDFAPVVVVWFYEAPGRFFHF